MDYYNDGAMGNSFPSINFGTPNNNMWGFMDDPMAPQGNDGGKKNPMAKYEQARRRDTDERDAVQKKTFTKWVNKHLLKAGRRLLDLYEDLKDGHNLISLLEVLAKDILPRERGHMRFHKIQNVNIALDYLRMKGI